MPRAILLYHEVISNILRLYRYFFAAQSLFVLIVGLILVVYGNLVGLLLIASIPLWYISRSFGFVKAIEKDKIAIKTLCKTTVLCVDSIKVISFSSYPFFSRITHLNVYANTGHRYYRCVVDIEYAKERIDKMSRARSVNSMLSEYKFTFLDNL